MQNACLRFFGKNHVIRNTLSFQKEREWREQEKQAALKKQKMIIELHEGRAKQIEDIRKTQARALARDEEDFKKVKLVSHFPKLLMFPG